MTRQPRSPDISKFSSEAAPRAGETEADARAELWILRHAQARSDGKWGSCEDRERPLTERGERQAQNLAEILERWAAKPTRILCSTAVRARQTLAGAGAALAEVPQEFESALYLASAGEVLHILQQAQPGFGELERVMVVAHNPGLSDLALALADESDPAHARELEQLERMLPTAALCRLALPPAGWSAFGPGRCRILGYERGQG